MATVRARAVPLPCAASRCTDAVRAPAVFNSHRDMIQLIRFARGRKPGVTDGRRAADPRPGSRWQPRERGGRLHART